MTSTARVLLGFTVVLRRPLTVGSVEVQPEL
jgi:hypothetical protein